MIPVLESRIRDRATDWLPGEPALGRLWSVLRSNPENDGHVTNSGAAQAGTIVFTFLGDRSVPSVVTKLVSSSLGLDAVRRCLDLQSRVNDRAGRRVYPTVFEVEELGDALAIYMEPVAGPNYELAVSRAIAGPEASSGVLLETVERQFREIGELSTLLRGFEMGDAPVTWGAKAVVEFERCVNEWNLLPPKALDVKRFRAAVDRHPAGRHVVLVEDHLANFLPGGVLVDQFVPDIDKLIDDWPGCVDALRVLVGYARASPLPRACLDYSLVSVLAVSILDGFDRGPIEDLFHRAFQSIGLPVDDPEAAWAHVVGVLMMRARRELAFHARNDATRERLKVEFRAVLSQAVDVLRKVATGQPSSLNFEPARLDVERLDVNRRVCEHEASYQLPVLVEQDVNGFNIVVYQGQYLALAQSLGAVDLPSTSQDRLREWTQSGSLLAGTTIDEIRNECRGRKTGAIRHAIIRGLWARGGNDGTSDS